MDERLDKRRMQTTDMSCRTYPLPLDREPEKAAMDNEIQIISDADGLAVIGEPKAVKRFLRRERLWTASKSMDLSRLKPLLDHGSDIMAAASEFSTNSGRWIKLTEESARLVKEHGLVETTTPGVSHLMVGVPGKVKNWLQTEQDVGSLLTSPAALSGVAGLMAQVASQQAMAEIVAYLERIDTKVDDVLGKVDDTVLKDLVGARLQIRRACTMRKEERRVTADSWSEVQTASGKLADTQGYALRQLDAVTKKLEGKSIRKLTIAADEAKAEVQKWLAVLADTFRLQEAFDVLALDKAMDESPEVLNDRRRGLEADRKDRRELIAGHTQKLLTRMDTAVGRANKKLPLTRSRSLSIIDAGNYVAAGVHGFHALLGLQVDCRSWEPRQLRTVVDAGSKALQKTKDATPYVGAAAGVLLLGALANKARDSDSS